MSQLNGAIPDIYLFFVCFQSKLPKHARSAGNNLQQNTIVHLLYMQGLCHDHFLTIYDMVCDVHRREGLFFGWRRMPTPSCCSGSIVFRKFVHSRIGCMLRP